MENIYEYLNAKTIALGEKLRTLDIESKGSLNRCVAKKDKHTIMTSKIEKTLIDNDQIIDYSVHGSGKNIEDRSGALLPLPSISGKSIELPSIIETDEVTGEAVCTITGNINKKCQEIIDKSSLTGLRGEYLFPDRLGTYTINNLANTKVPDSGLFYEISISLPVLRKINYLEIEGGTGLFQYIEYIRYSKTDMEYHSRSVSFDKTILNGDLSIKLKPFTCKTIYIGMVQPHYTLTSKDSKTMYAYPVNLTKVRAGYKCYDYRCGIDSNVIDSNCTGDVYLSADIDSSKERFLSEEFSLSYDGYTFHNILPSSANTVYERLHFHRGFSRLRFPAKKINAVRANGELLLKWKENIVSGLIVSVIVNSMPGVIYTIEYLPTSSAYKVSVSDVPFTYEEDKIQGTGSISYSLASTPLDYNDVVVEVFDTIKARIYSGDKVINETSGSTWNSSKFKYRIAGDMIIFDSEMDDRFIVNVKYKSKGIGVIVRTVLRRNTDLTLEDSSTVSNIKLTNEKEVIY